MIRKIKKIGLVFVGLVAIVGLVLTVTTSPALAKQKTWRLRGQAAWGRGIKQLWGATEKVAELIECYTAGRVKLELHTGGELVGTLEEYPSAGSGALDFGMGCPCYAMSRCYALPFFCDSPGNISGTEKIVWLYHGGGLEIFQDLFKKHYNVMAFPFAIQTAEVFLYANKEIKSLKDLKGLKMRAAGLRADIMHYLGGSLVVLGASEVIPAMERGVIDAFEVSNIALGQEVGYLEAAKYLYFTPRKTNHSLLLIVFNLEKWNSFPKDIQKKIAQACHDSVLWAYAWNREADVVAMKKATEKYGVQLKLMPEEVMRKFNEAALTLYAKKAQKDPEVARVMESWEKFSKEWGNIAPFVDYLDKTGGYFGQMIPYSEMKKRVAK
ncbi:MAG: TRAP transporter substrate-binding protein DctP [Deltaproteobacteria bacterium]|nr:TRAP transporter substrate-binding protein DctP [Deltaproteobacteria bacterium]MBW1931122.1 TRAP transporter substrate-binding protein DctP [Deltaproteobacteria bacterium]MBW2025509.1 TRAP transporter substrate-binding protein DctP [Deltaproteobacteria bacterium]MBW2125307.1 TRAP transporter substrate-binding protein DctP [Deltaproteobacteria bacterium]